MSPRARIDRGGGKGYLGAYSAATAHRVASRRALCPKPRRLDHTPLRDKVWQLFAAHWSPEQIAGSLPGVYPRNPRMRVSHETIYQSVFVQTKGELKRELTAHLRTGRTRRKPRTGGAKRYRLGITEEICISSRQRRSSRFVVLAPLSGRHTAEITRMTLAQMIATLPIELRRSITWDRGLEMAEHAQFRIDTGVPIYFGDPFSPWQRGTNENTNGLLRQYWPKGSDLRGLSQTECDDVALRLKTRPCKTLEWQTPGHRLNISLVASTG
jgi:IS30 family transposase